MARPPDAPGVLVIGCGALVKELHHVIRANRLDNVRVECLPAALHNQPEKIPAAVRAKLEAAAGYQSIFVAYGDCGTGGRLDAMLEEFDVERLPGAHCYQFFAGLETFQRMHEEEPGTLYLTDYLARHFDRLIWHGLGLDRWPELAVDYFGNYRRLVHLAQTDDSDRDLDARGAAERLGLSYERRMVGFGEVEPALVRLSTRRVVATA